MAFYNKELNSNQTQALAQALAGNRRSMPQVTPFQPVRAGVGSASSSADLSGLGGLAKGLLGSDGLTGLFGKGDTAGSEPVSSAIDNFVLDKPQSQSAVSDAISGGSSGSAVGNAIGAEVGSSGFNMPGWLSVGTGLLNGLNRGLGNSDDKKIMGGVGNGIQGFFNVNEKDSDVMQGINGTLDGAMKGTMIFPGVGTVVGGLLGLGSSFLDDI